jgi:hypothetical protein
MFKVNLDFALFRQLPAKAVGRPREAQVFELRGMQSVGQALHIPRDLRDTFLGMTDMRTNFFAGVLRHSIQFHS